jgi:uncharacterized protein
MFQVYVSLVRQSSSGNCSNILFCLQPDALFMMGRVEMFHSIWLAYTGLALIGFTIGGYGTLVGAGGGFLLMPVLMFIYPHMSPSELAGVSLACILVNTISGGIAFAKQGRIDYKSALLFAITIIPGSLLGAMATKYVPRADFEGVFAGFLIALSAFMFLKKTESGEKKPAQLRLNQKSSLLRKPTTMSVNGIVFEYEYNRLWGMITFLFLGFIVSFLGIGGGALIVPTLIYLMNFPVFIAAGTSTLIIAIVCFTSTSMHVALGTFDWWSVIHIAAIGGGMMFGAQIGAHLSSKVKGVWIVRALAAALGAAGVKMILAALAL